MESIRQNKFQQDTSWGKNKVIALKKPEEIPADLLTELLRKGARQLRSDAVEVVLHDLLSQYAAFRNEQEHQQLARNGYLPEREIQTGIGPVKIRIPKIRDKSGQGIKFNSTLLPPCLRKIRSVEELFQQATFKKHYKRFLGVRQRVVSIDNQSL